MPSQAVSDTLPHSEEAERSVLGAILLDNRSYDRAQEMLEGEAFYSLRNRTIFETLTQMIEGGAAPDLVTLKDALAGRGALEECGGPAYLASLIDGVPRSANIEHYARIVREKAVLRELIRTSQTILSSALQKQGTTNQLLDDAERAIFRIAENRLGGGFIPVSYTHLRAHET